MTHRDTPLDKNLRKVFSELVSPGMYFTCASDQSMAPFIRKDDVLAMQEDQAIGRIVELIYKGKRYIRKCVQGQKEQYWVFAPLDDSFPYFTSTPYNIDETEIIGSLRFIMRFGDGVDPSELLEAGEFAKLQTISEFRRVKEINFEGESIKVVGRAET